MHIVPSGNEKMMLFVKALLSTGRQITRYCFRSMRCLHIGLAWGAAIGGVESYLVQFALRVC